MSFDLFLYADGYWGKNDAYLGGETHEGGKHLGDGFTLRKLTTLMVKYLGFEDNMSKVSWFSPETPSKDENIDDDETLTKAVHYGIGSDALTLYVVREDDPYIDRRVGAVTTLADEVDDLDVNNEVDCDGGGENVNGDVNEDSSGGEEDYFSGSDSDGKVELDEKNYRGFEVGQEYKTIDSFKSALNRYAVKKKRDIKYKKSYSKRVSAICSDGKCPWRIYASINSSSLRVIIRSLQDEHNCTWQGKVSLLTNPRLAEIFIEEFRLNPDFSANQLQEKLLAKNINVPWTKCKRSRLRCLQTFDDEQAEHFARLFDYIGELKISNPGSTVECEMREGRFHRFYVCFTGLSEGWKAACRRILHLDGTFLKWRMTGMLLVVCGRDSNDQMFPIAWGIVEVENKPKWLWFLEHLQYDLELNMKNGLILGSDQQKGLIATVKDLLPYAEHKMCARHVHAYWKKNHSRAELQDLFWAAVDAYYPQAFDRKMKELKAYDTKAYADLKISISCPWSRAFFTPYSKCDAVENNLGESFNAVIRVARTKPIVEMLEEIRRRVMVSNSKKMAEAFRAKGEYPPRAVALLDQQIDLTKNCRILPCRLGKYEFSYFTERYVVHLRNETSCTCRLYLISGIPCCHIASGLRLEKDADQDPKILISPWFTVEKWRQCYANALKPVNGMNLWKETTDVRVIPPPYKRPPGRPPGKKKRKEKGEANLKIGKQPKRGIKMHCSNCGQEGHNKSKYTNAPVPKPPKKPHGRPKSRATMSGASAWLITEGGSSNTVQRGSSSQPAQSVAWRPWSDVISASNSQPVEDLPSLSSALPRKMRGRPRNTPTCV